MCKEKTLVEMMLTIGRKRNEIKQLQDKIDYLYDDLDTLKSDIAERFAPKHLVGQEFIISRNQSSDYPNDTLDWMDKGFLPHRNQAIPDWKETLADRKFKCDYVHIVVPIINEKGYFIRWQMIGRITDESGKYGLKEFSFDFVDKVEIEK